MKYIILLASLVIQICLGGVYAWSALVPALQDTVDFSVAQTQIIFGCLFAVFTLSMVLSGKLLDRLGPRWIASIGAVLFGAGYVLASFSGGNFPVMLLGIGVLTGAGTGFGYVCPLTTCMRWFPNRRGLVTGVSMAGFGGGAVLLSALAEHLLSDGMHVLTFFRWIGLGYGLALLAAALVLRFPESVKAVASRPASVAKTFAADPFFFLCLLLGMFCGTFAGMLVIGNLKPIGLAAGVPAVQATAAISVFAAGNAAGRVTWGWLSDRVDARLIPIKMTVLGVPIALLAWVSSSAMFIIVSFAVGFGFGACFVVYAAQVASRYGLARVGGIYPVVFLAYGLAGILGPSLGGWLYDTTDSYGSAIALGCGVLAVGLIGSTLLLWKANSTAPVGSLEAATEAAARGETGY
ncbi:MAG: MFS transporter [Phycisphaerae bacterium]